MENVLREVGQCGKFQIYHVAVVQLSYFVSANAFFLMVFGLYNPGWRCVNTNISSSLRPTDISEISTVSNLMDKEEVVSSSSKLIRSQHSAMIPVSSVKNDSILSGVNSRNQKLESALYNGTCDVIKFCDSIQYNPASSTIVSEFNLVCDKVWIAYTIVSVLTAGMLAGAFVCGYIGERFGRKKSLYACTFIMTISCGLAVLSPVWEVYALCTFFIGFGVAGIMPTVSVLCMEFLTSKWRARVTAIPVWSSGIICLALLSFLLRDWRQIHLVITFVGGIACLGYFWTPESLRWLSIHGKNSDAEQVVFKMSKLNKNPVRLETLKDLMEKGGNNEVKRHYTYLDLFKTNDVRGLVIKLGVIRVVSVLVYDIIGFGIQSLPGDFYTNIIVASIIEVPPALSIGLLANRIGRRWTTVLLISLGALCGILIVTFLLVLEKDGIRDILITSLALINRSAMQALITLMMTFTSELLPTAIRNVSLGFFNTLGRATAIVGPYLLPRDYPSMVICFAVLMVLQLITSGVAFSLPETKDRPLKDMMPTVNIKKPSEDNS